MQQYLLGGRYNDTGIRANEVDKTARAYNTRKQIKADPAKPQM